MSIQVYPVLKGIILIVPFCGFALLYLVMALTSAVSDSNGLMSVVPPWVYAAIALCMINAGILGAIAGRLDGYSIRKRRIFLLGTALGLYFLSAYIIALIMIITDNAESMISTVPAMISDAAKLAGAGGLMIGIVMIPVLMLYMLALERWTRRRSLSAHKTVD